VTTYLGFTVWELEPDRREDPDSDYALSKVRLDSRAGLFTDDALGPTPNESRPVGFLLRGRPEIAAFQTMLDALQGRLTPFWLPTWRHDFRLVTDRAPGDLTLLVEGISYSRFGFSTVDYGSRHLALLKPEGGAIAAVYRGVTAALDNGNGTETLTLSATLGVAYPKDRTMVSFLSLVRLDDDAPALRWHHQALAEATLRVVDLNREAPAPA